MERKQISAVPIVKLDKEKILLKGIVTTSDLRGITDEKMLSKEMHHLVVIDQDKVAGIISSMDFVEIAARE